MLFLRNGRIGKRRMALPRALLITGFTCAASLAFAQSTIGREVAVEARLQDGDESRLSPYDLIQYGARIFNAHFTSQEGAGRPLTTGVGKPLSDQKHPLVFPRNANRISGPDSNSCAGCHNQPISGGSGDLSSNVFVLGQRFDFAVFNAKFAHTPGTEDEEGLALSLQSIADSRSTTDMFGSGFYEMLARQITADLRTIRDRLQPGTYVQLESKGISFGILARKPDGTWDTSFITGLPPQALASSGPNHPPSLVIRPFHQSGSTVSLREFTVDAFNQHVGMQATERFGAGTDPDGDGVVNELNKADITACALYQATLPVPTRGTPSDPAVRKAAQQGEKLFSNIGCASCHILQLPLTDKGWIYTEPGPYNPPGTLQTGQGVPISVDLTDDRLPGPRLKPVNGVVMVPVYTDFKLHDICRGPDDPNREPLNANQLPGSAKFFAGNGKFLTRRLWTAGSKPNYFHHGQFTTIRESILNHFGEALKSQQAFTSLTSYEQGAVIEFLKTLQIQPLPGTSTGGTDVPTH